MGLLGDYMSSGMLPTDPGQNQAARQGLLQFGAALLGGRGNFGQILGQGLAAGAGGYNGAIQQQQQAALMAAQKQRLDLDNQETQAKIDEPANLAKILGPGPGAPTTGAAPGVRPLSALPQIGASTASAAPAAAPMTAPAAQPSLYDTYMAYGDRLTQAGRPTQAKAYYDLAEKMRPEVQEVKTGLDTSGKPVSVIRFKDGSEKTSSYGALPDNQVVDLGGQQVLVDKNTGKQGASFAKTVSPSDRLNRDTQLEVQRMIGQRQAEARELGVTHGVKGLTPEQNDALFGENGAVTTGRLDPNRINSRTAPIFADAYIKNPNMDMAKLSGDIALGRNAAFRQKAMVAETLPEVMHSMVEAGKKVGFSDNRTIGKMQAWAKGEFNDPDMTEYMVQRNDALMTIAGVMRGMGMTDMAHRAEEEASHATMSPAALDAWMRAQMKSLQPRLDVNRRITRDGPQAPKSVADLPKKAAPGGHPADINNLLTKYGAK